MKNNASLFYSVALLIGDSIALLAAFAIAYVLRVSLDHTPISAHVRALTYIEIVVTLLPLFLIVFALFGLYDPRVQWKRFREFGRLALGCLIGVMGVISYSYLANIHIFPARLVTLYGFLLAFFFVLLFRTGARGVRRILFRYVIGIDRVLLIGDTALTLELVTILADTAAIGYKVAGIVDCSKHKPADSDIPCFDNFDTAITAVGGSLNTIIQTELYADDKKNDEILVYAQEHHLSYHFVPGNSERFVGNIEAELFQSVPVITVNQTALTGWGRVVKRLTDVCLSLIAIVLTAPIMLVVALAVKLYDGGPVFYRDQRLTRGDRAFTMYKFRSHNIKYSGLRPEEAFAKMGKPELAIEYRKNGDKIPNDPRITPIGRIIRKTSVDELGQLFNVLKGDISLVGPRALATGEMESVYKYKKRHVILSVKSGITGLAQVSGRRNLNFDEKRQLDVYYVQNWSFWGDLVIMARTVWVVLNHRSVG